MELISDKGRTAIVYRAGKGLVCRVLWNIRNERLVAEFDNASNVERQLL